MRAAMIQPSVRRTAPLLLLLAGCLADPTSAIDQEIVGGGTQTWQRPEVGSFTMRCGATLIGPMHAITAAHCLVPEYTGTTPAAAERFIMIGSVQGIELIPIADIHTFASKRYEYTLSGSMTSDVALLTLEHPVTMAEAVPVALATHRPTFGDRSTLWGFGCTKRGKHDGGAKQYYSFSFGTLTMVLCPGDSGGPVFYGEALERRAIWGINSDYIGVGDWDYWTDVFGDVVGFGQQIEALMRGWGVYEVGFDRPGPSYQTFPAADPWECLDACNRDHHCRSFTFGAIASTEVCQLKQGVGDLTPSAGMIAGLPTVSEWGIARPGGDYSDFAITEDRVELCAAACARDSWCLAYTYVDATASEPGHCYLKDEVFPAVDCASCTSGTYERAAEYSQDRPGLDYETREVFGDRECERACAADALCLAYTYVPDPQWGYFGNCNLKNGVPSPVESQGLISGVKRGVETDLDRPGAEYQSFPIITPSAEICQAACAADEPCQAWVYEPATPTGLASCHLKNAIPYGVITKGFVSGKKGLEFRQ
jgi:V8-like Glu-specific endopeptidase